MFVEYNHYGVHFLLTIAFLYSIVFLFLRLFLGVSSIYVFAFRFLLLFVAKGANKDTRDVFGNV